MSFTGIVLWGVLSAVSGFSGPAAASAPCEKSPVTGEVRIIYLVPSDRSPRPQYRHAIVDAVHDLQKWYAYHTAGMTFRVSSPVIETLTSSHPASWFDQNALEYDQKLWTFYNALADVTTLIGPREEKPLQIWVIYVDAPGGTGAGMPGVAVLPEHDLKGLIGEHPKEKYLPRWAGGLGHELGHAFGLAHPGDDHADSIMQYGYITYPNCDLTEEASVALRYSPFFRWIRRKTASYEPYERGSYLYDSGFFVQLGRKRWEERKYHSGMVFRFREIERDPDSIVLQRSEGEDLRVRLEIKAGNSQCSLQAGPWKDLYAIRSGYDQSRKTAARQKSGEEGYVYDKGAFLKTEGSQWVEVTQDGRMFLFEETGRDEEFVVIRDASRDLSIRFSPRSGWCEIATGDTSLWQRLYEVRRIGREDE